jgi:hypothetical protein
MRARTASGARFAVGRGWDGLWCMGTWPAWEGEHEAEAGLHRRGRAVSPVGQEGMLKHTLSRADHPRHRGEAFEQLAKDLLCCLRVAPILDEHV